MRQMIDMTNQRFGRLVAKSFIHGRLASGESRVYWKCKCDCGNACTVAAGSLRSGNTKSCGCYCRDSAKRRMLTHGDNINRSTTPEYNAWASAKARCENERHPKYPSYGARGIKMCDRWKENYVAFLEDMGRRPSPSLSIDRIDNDDDYEPGNCRWAMPIEQGNNRRNNRRIEVNGVSKTISEWARVIGISPCTLGQRLRSGWPENIAATAPKGTRLSEVTGP